MPEGLVLLGIPFVSGVATVVEVTGGDVVVENEGDVVVENVGVVVVAVDVVVLSTLASVVVGCGRRFALIGVRRLRARRDVVPARSARFVAGPRGTVVVAPVSEPARGARASPVAYDTRVRVAPTTATTNKVRP